MTLGLGLGTAVNSTNVPDARASSLQTLINPWHSVDLFCFFIFWHQLILRSKLKKQITQGSVSCVCFYAVGRHFLFEEEGGDHHVSCNYIYVGSHSIRHSKFCLTCHIVNHHSGLNAGYELKRPAKDSFFVVIAVFVCFWQASCDDISCTVFSGCFQ